MSAQQVTQVVSRQNDPSDEATSASKATKVDFPNRNTLDVKLLGK